MQDDILNHKGNDYTIFQLHLYLNQIFRIIHSCLSSNFKLTKTEISI